MGQYYQVLQQQPDVVHQFYSEASNMIRVDGDSSESASAILVPTIFLFLYVFSDEFSSLIDHELFLINPVIFFQFTKFLLMLYVLFWHGIWFYI